MENDDKTKATRARHGEVTFKPYAQNQSWLLPPSLGELIPFGHIVRLVNDVVEGMDLAPIINEYKGGGSSSYHPRMMIKVLVYGYVEKRYSSREIEKALKENICFMWLSGMQRPDHNTLNRFRNSQLKQTVKEVFSHVLSLLIKEGYVRLEQYYLDGTKIESVAGRYSYVWAKNIERYKGALLDKISLIIEQIELANQTVESTLSQSDRTDQESRTISTSNELSKTIEELNNKLKEESKEDKEIVKQVKKLEQEHLPKLQSYEDQEELLNGRNSYSKTDIDATFMRTKEDHLGNGQLKPCYNIQMGTENQFIVNYTVHQTPSDMVTFTHHMDDTTSMLENIQAPQIKRVCADAGYGSEQNYEYLEEKQITAFVKYPGYYKENKSKYKNDPFYPANLYYNATDDYYVCPMGQHMNLQSIKTQTSKAGYEQTVHFYKAQNCRACPLRGQCHSSKTERLIQVNHKAQHYRRIAKQNLSTLWGIRMKSKRGIDVESVFGHIKQDRHFRRFLLTSIEGVSTETGLLAIAHNLKKWWTAMIKIIDIRPLPPAKPIGLPIKYMVNSLSTLNLNQKRVQWLLMNYFLKLSLSSVTNNHNNKNNFQKLIWYF